MALVVPRQIGTRERAWRLAVLGLSGIALLYGDGMITLAISASSAIEGFLGAN